MVLYPIVKRQSQIGALGYVTARIMESAFIMVGLLSLVALVALRQDLGGAAGADAAALEATARSLVSVYEFAFLFGPGLVVGFGNGLILGWLMYRSGLVPRRLAMLGLIGGPSLIVAFVLVLSASSRRGPRGSLCSRYPRWFGRRRFRSTAYGKDSGRPRSSRWTLVCPRSNQAWTPLRKGTEMAQDAARLPPRWFVVTAWHVHRLLVRASGRRKGLWAPRPGKWVPCG